MTNHRASVAAARRASRRTFTGSASLAVIARQLLRVAAIGALTPLPVAAQITPGGTHAPTMDMAMNGTPVVRITTPDSAGISHNSYTQFNVDGRGLILNNSDQIVTTRLAGYIDGNRNIKTGDPARLILNEVVSTGLPAMSGPVV